jgi:NADH dehydrogenase [ubiquinone] 1 alpha subcomplex assembly factor 7
MKEIINKFYKKKSIPLNEFMNFALYDEKHGYYIKKNPFGKKGDFITSPHVSNLFGEMISIWCVAYWEYLGKPKKILLVELGAGDGTLCETMLNTFKKFEKFYQSLEINLLEISNKLRKTQKNKISSDKVKWIGNINEIKKGPIIFLGNEFFDALAIKQFYKKKKILFEKFVTLNKNKKKLKFIFKRVNKNLSKKLNDLDLMSNQKIIEYPIDSIKYLNQIIKKMHLYNGSLLIFDYGYVKKINGKDTLQSVRKHAYSNPLLNVGGSDITSLVNFELIKHILEKKNLSVKKITTQSEFLQKMGIYERANILSSKMNFKEKIKLNLRLKKLLAPDQMGNLFKVLVAQKNDNKFSLGF